MPPVQISMRMVKIVMFCFQNRNVALLRRKTRISPDSTACQGNFQAGKRGLGIVFALVMLFSLPGASIGARISGEDQPVATAPVPSAASTPQKAPLTAKENPVSRTEPTVPAETKKVAPPVKAAEKPKVATPTAATDAAASDAVVKPVTGSAASPAGTVAPRKDEKEPSAGVRAPRFGAASPAAQKPVAGQTSPAVGPVPAPPVPTAGQSSPVSPAPTNSQPVPAPPVPAIGQPAPASPSKTISAPPVPPPTASAASGRYVTIDFDNVDISVFIKFVSELTGRNFVVDDKVKGKVTVISPRKIAVDEVYKVFESVLEIYGFATVQAGEVIKVVPALDARGKNLELRLKREAVSPEDRIVTQILSLQNANPNEIKKVLDPLVSKTSIVLAYPPTGMLIITDVLSNIKRLQDIVTALDVDGVGEVISYIPLKYASAQDMVKSLNLIFQQQAAKGALSPVKIVADDRTNALIMLASENDTRKVKELLALMDKDIPRGAGAIRVYYLQNAKAEDLVKVLTGLPQQGKTPDPKAAAAAPLSKNVQVVADKSTNALVITADTADYMIIEDVIRKLDITRPMVYLEALIMEVNANKDFGVGVEWSALKDVGATGIGDEGSRNLGAVGFNTGTSIFPKITTDTTGISTVGSLASGFSLGVLGAGIRIGNIVFPNVGAVLQAYQNDTDIRILSTPQLLTLDNEEAEITVGSNIPYVTRQDTTSTSDYNYSSYEYKDVGVTLKVTPQINKEGFIRMKLDQSVTKVDSASATVDNAGNKILAPTTLKRTAKTTVTIKDGQTVVIGGMIEDNSSSGTYKVPLLGDIPILGWLFKSHSKAFDKTNLFIFITPRIIRNPEDAADINEDKKDYMKTITEGTIKNTPVKKDRGTAPVIIEGGDPTKEDVPVSAPTDSAHTVSSPEGLTGR